MYKFRLMISIIQKTIYQLKETKIYFGMNFI